MNYRELMRRQLLQRMFEQMSDEDKLAYLQLIKKDEHQELLDAIHAQDGQISRIAQKVEKQNWLSSFTSDVLANFTSAGILYLGSKLLKRF